MSRGTKPFAHDNYREKIYFSHIHACLDNIFDCNSQMFYIKIGLEKSKIIFDNTQKR